MRLIACVATAASLAACAKTGTYSYQRKLEVKFPEDYAPAPMTAEAREVLSTARSVAFSPPDFCVEPDDRRHGVEVEQGMLRLDCGVIVSALERSAEQAGYRVVSFRTLRGSDRPIDYAKRSAVDILFEINELAFDRLTDRDARTDLAFFSETDTGTFPAAPSQAVAERCASLVKQQPSRDVALSGTIDIKMVRVTDGQNLWHYRRTRGAQLEESSSERYQKTTTTVGGPVGLALGGATLVGGLVVGGASLCPPGDYRCEDVNSYISKGMMITGGVVAVVGLVLVLATKAPGVDEVLCTSALTDARKQLAAPAPQFASRRTTYSIEEHANSSNTHQEERQKLRAEIVEDFLKVMSEVRRRDVPSAVTSPTSDATLTPEAMPPPSTPSPAPN